MSEKKKDRFQRVDKAIDEVREEFNEAVDDSKKATDEAREEVREAIDNLEARLKKLRNRNKDE
jgi:cell fate (sporulation/competence/biofilm development) regulator YmcA (YheA/YmcA/DUF963 family)